jgi:g-D-glutamyl-meso-diaminopimelate peptidase
VQINASFHANEWITTPVFMKFLNEYMLALTNGASLKGVPAITMYAGSELSAVPMVNPDGVNLVLNGPPQGREEELVSLNRGIRDFSGWKANIRGVDLNKQFPANWEFEKERKPKEPGPRDFPGYTPLSEPETKTMAELARSERYDRLIALHTQGREIYWGYEGLEPPESEVLARDFARLSGYEAVRYVDSHAGYKDWFIQEFRKPGFTLELGLGQNPLPIEQFDEIYAHVLGIFVRSLI